MSMEESISLEETNKIRISLGLKPLTDDGAPSATDGKEKQAEDNYAKQRERDAKDREAKKIQDKIAKVRNRRELNASLKGSTLGDADGEEDIMKWVKRSKKKEKELVKKRQQELESMDRIFLGEEYTERDLVGLKVSHDFGEMEEGEAHILTLKDSRILDNEEDELQNVELAEDDARRKRHELKAKKRDYTGYDDEEFVDGKIGMKRSVLAKYDDELEGPSETGFRLGSSAKPAKEVRLEEQQIAAAAVNKSLLSIDYAKNLELHDYVKEGDKGFKKTKTKKKRQTRRAPAETELGDADEMVVDMTSVVPRERDLDTNFVDDDELQAALARTRRAKLRKTAKISPEELAKRIAAQKIQDDAEESSAMKVEDDDPAPDRDSGLTFDDTSEFVRAVGNNAPLVKKEAKVESVHPPDREASTSRQSKSRDVSMAPGDEAVTELEAGEVSVKEEEEGDYDMAMLDDIERVLRDAEEEAKKNADTADTWTSEEQTFKSGMAATLSILRNQGILSAPSADMSEREKVQKQRDAWLSEQRRRVTERELDRLQSRGGNRDQATREYENRMRDQQEARENMESFKHYKPDVNIVYYDDNGRQLTPKEAWKALSHKFHGKGSGKMKTEKRLKKIAEEKKKEAMASGDTPLSMNAAFLQRQEKAGQAHFVLSVGNRGAVPQAPDFLETQPLAKGKTEKAKKKKESKKGGQMHEPESGFMTVPPPQSAVIASGPTSATGSPVPKPGFSRVGSVSDKQSTRDGTPGTVERSKVAFGFGSKRKAEEEANGTPPPKRR